MGVRNLREIILLGIILFASSIFLPPRPVLAHIEGPGKTQSLGIDEKLGRFIPLDVAFSAEDGRPVILRELIRKPTILALVYLHCRNVCGILLENLADVLNQLPAEPGADYEVLTVSFDEHETPALTSEKKKLYLQMITRPFPKDAWRFLTGDRENIHRLTEAVGFHFKRVGEDFEHPVTLIILSPGGKIVRYMYGIDILPFDMKMALVEAKEGRIGPAITKVLRFCFSYDPKAKKLVFNVLRVTGGVTLLFAGSVLYLALKCKNRFTGKE